jgi:hypothetical protein
MVPAAGAVRPSGMRRRLTGPLARCAPIRPLQPQGQPGAQPYRLPGRGLQAGRDIGVPEDRKAPVVEGDHLGQDLGAEPVPVARDGIDPEPGTRGRSTACDGTGSTPAGRMPQHQPRPC